MQGQKASRAEIPAAAKRSEQPDASISFIDKRPQTQQQRSIVAASALSPQSLKLAALGHAVQRRAFVGPGFKQPESLADPKVRALADDEQIRRFKDEAELKAFAAAGAKVGIGAMPDHTWVRLDTPPMQVLGEDHGDAQSPAIIRATGITRFRYEGYTKHSQDRLANSAALLAHAAVKSSRATHKLDVPAEDAAITHAAELAAPKYARVLPDVQDLSAAQAAAQPFDKLAVTAGTPLPAGYSLAKALLREFESSLVYAKSYGGKWTRHPLKLFYKAHAAAVDAAIDALNAAVAANRYPDFSALRITAQLEPLTQTYESAARAKVGLKKKSQRDAFKAQLNLKDEPKVASSDRAKENDYLRDASMLAMVKEAQQGGDSLFVMGDAHRRKLQPLFQGLGLPVAEDKVFLDQQRDLDAAADAGPGAAALVSLKSLRKMAADIKDKIPQLKHVGDTLKLGKYAVMDNCTWEIVSDCEEGAEGGSYVTTGTDVALNLIWSAGSTRLTISKLSYTLRAAAAPIGAAPVAPVAAAAPVEASPPLVVEH